MTNNSYDKVKLIILRAALVLIGAGLGFLALWQYFLFYPNVVKREYQIVITVVSAALVAIMFGLSAKAVYRLISSVATAVSGLKERVGARGIFAVLLGFLVAGGIVVAFDVLIKRVVDIWAVRLLADILVFILFSAALCVGFTKWMTAPKSQKPQKADVPAVGYLVAAECFSDERVLTAVHTLINVKVIGDAYKALCLYGGESGAAAARLMDTLIKSGAISVLNVNKPFDDGKAYEQLEKQVAASKRLKRISLDGGEKELALALFSQPSVDIVDAFTALRAKDETEPEVAQKTLSDGAAADDVNGQIIIDK
ncbi:MAG: hypothetical protein K2O39_02280 [Clostridiales bacterium]|nr:hypothetical protein [Clostridiales bacterium]